MIKRLIPFLLLILSPLAWSQVTLTASSGVTSSNGILYAQGTYSINLVSSTGQDLTNAPLTVGGVTLSVPSQTGKLSATGTFTITLPLTNSSITSPTGTQYRLSICSINPVTQPVNVPLPPQVCFTYTATFNSSTDLSSTLSALAPPLQLPNGCPVSGPGCTVSGNLTVTGGITATTTNNVCTVFGQLGTDWAAKVNACISALPAGGGLIDATGTTGSQTCSSANISLPAHSTLRLGAGTNISGSCQITMNGYSAIEGSGGTGNYADGTSANAGTTWTYTGSSGNLITLAATVNNAYATRVAYIRFIGKLATSGGSGSGNGFFASPGSPASSYSNVGITLDHATFQGFYGDGIHLEDNVYLVDCIRCSAEQNGGYGLWLGTNLTTTGPSQIDMFSARINSNVTGQVFMGGGNSATDSHWFGGTIANDLSPQFGTTSTCINAQASTTAVFASFYATHFEGCGKTSGTTSFIDWNVANGSLSLRDASFTNASSYTAIPIYLDTSWGSSVVIGPGTGYSVPSATDLLYNANASSSGTVEIYDEITASTIGGSIVAGFHFNNADISYNRYLASLPTFFLPTASRLYFNSGYQLVQSGGLLYLQDSGGNNLMSFNQTGNPITVYQNLVANGSTATSTLAVGGGTVVNSIAVATASCGTTAASVGATATCTISWGFTLANATYKAACTLTGVTAVPTVVGTSAKSMTGMTVTIAALTAVAATGTAECHAFD